ncbi:MAG: HlyD family efflux transporter periplasmic adaptor subunit [Caldilineaceae bacterium]|nr:HlyD family efflux transporter periplasmic adaptor subunit [Caldilineaceae bacterium]
MKRINVILLAIAIIGAGAYYYWGLRPRAMAADVALASAPLSMPQTDLRVSNDIFIIGVVVPVRHASLSMGTAGKIDEILVKEGDVVEAGQPLLRLVSDQQAVAVTQAEADLRAAQANLAKLQAGPVSETVTVAQAAVDIAQANLAKISADAQDLTLASSQLAVNKATAEAEVRRAQAELDLLQSGTRAEDIAAGEAAVASAEADLQTKQLELAVSELRAPFAGTIASVDFEVGEYVDPDSVVLTIADLAQWQVQSNELDELNVVNVQVGDEVTIAFDAIPGLELTGTLAHIKPLGTYDDGHVTYTVIVVPNERDPGVYWNMTAQLTIKN